MWSYLGRNGDGGKPLKDDGQDAGKDDGDGGRLYKGCAAKIPPSQNAKKIAQKLCDHGKFWGFYCDPLKFGGYFSRYTLYY